jgi:hypothetical protein
MFRRSLAVVVVLAAAAVGAACGKAAATHEVVPGARVGIVLEAAGTVTATRAGASRPLKVGDAVSGDDRIETGADGSVLIELDHNHVTFTLPAGKAQQVSTSLAWNQPVAAARPTTTDESSAAAGRAIERSAVDTAASTGQPRGAARDVEPAKGEKQAKEDDEDRGGRGGEADIIAEPLNKKPFKDVSPGQGVPENVRLDQAPPPEPDNDEPVTPVTPPPTLPLAAGPSLAVALAGGLTEGEVTAKIHAGDLVGCWKTLPATTTITLVVHSAGRITKVTSSDAGAASCLTTALEKVEFAPRRAGTTITLTLTK